MELHLQEVGVLQQFEIGQAHGRHGRLTLEPDGRGDEGLLDPGAHDAVGGDEQILLRPEEPEEVGLRNAGPGRDGFGRGSGIAGPGELDDGGGEDGLPADIGALADRDHGSKIVITHITVKGSTRGRLKLFERASELGPAFWRQGGQPPYLERIV